MMESSGQRESEDGGTRRAFQTRPRSSVWSVRPDHPLCSSAPPATSIAGLVGRLEIDEYGEPDWTAVRSLADRADQYPNSALDSFASPPMRTPSDRVDNLIAGVAEIIADSNGREPLRW